MANETLKKAKENKNDEFYTQISDIENELKHYRKHFKNAIVFCNCDDPEWSNFWKYFHLNFEFLGLKKLITTHYHETEPTYKMEYEGGNDNDVTAGTKTALLQNGDFRSPECVELLKEADIVVTNPPFSLFREYIAQLMEYEKSFVIIGNQNAITYKEFFPLLMNNKVWLGVHNGDMAFRVPDDSEPRKTRFWIDKDGHKWRSLGNAMWVTNLDIAKRHEFIDLIETYCPEKYPKYDNYDAIEVSKTLDIPCDYSGAMGVPITFLSKYNPDQFKIIGMVSSAGYNAEIVGLPLLKTGDARPLIKGKNTYARILIRSKTVL